MNRILVTGATGALGSQVVRKAQEAGWAVRSMSRRLMPVEPQSDWVQANLLTGEGVEASVRDIDVIIHCASNSQEHPIPVEGEGTAKLLYAARQSGVSRVVYVSIVGIDGSDYEYYRAKVAGEAAIMSGGVPYTVVRMTQFHSLIQIVLESLSRKRMLLIPFGWRFQPLAPADAAAVLVDLAGQPAVGRVADVGGPEVRTLDDLASSWMAITGEHKRVFHFPMFGAISHIWRSGKNLVPDNPIGSTTWEEWLREGRKR